MKVLITGGAGYIGSVTTAYLLDNGFEVNVLDNLSTGHEKFIDKRAKFFLGDILESNSIIKAMNGCDSVVHLAGKAIVSESILKPHFYKENNHIGTLNILNSMKELSINKLLPSTNPFLTYNASLFYESSSRSDSTFYVYFNKYSITIQDDILKDLKNLCFVTFSSGSI